MRIYNLFPLLAGTFTDWPSHVERAAEMDFDWIFVNPVQKPGMSGSLYSIADYFELNPRLVDSAAAIQNPEQQLRDAIEQAESKGMRAMVDLVINHCAVDSNLVGEHPAWFVRDANGRVEHPFCNENGKKVVWGDLARFDHRGTSDPEGLYRYFYDVVDYLIGLGFSGFRCDAAYQIPGNLWQRLITEVKRRYPNVMFFAETLGCTPDKTRKTARSGFDYVFNSSKWWDFSSPWLLEQYNLTRETTRSISFPESHDTDRLFQEMGGNLEAMKQRYLFSALFSAGVMMPMGFEFGFRKRMHVVKTRAEDWEEPAVDLRDFIRGINAIKAQYPIFQQECPTKVIPYENPSILILWKASLETPEEALIVLNKDPWHHQHFYTERLDSYVQAGAPLVDRSPEYRLDYLPTPFNYDLRPGQGFVFVTQRDAEED
jgi:starch synthase (maltosyl-transferring)